MSKPLLRQIVVSLMTVTLTFLLLVSYALLRESQRLPSERPPLRVALLQGSFRASLSATPEWYEKVFAQYQKMAIDASVNKQNSCDIIIWPESTCIYPWVDIDRTELTTETTKKWSDAQLDAILAENNKEIIELTQVISVPCIYGVGSYIFSEKQDKNFQYNSALLIESTKKMKYDFPEQMTSIPQVFRYDKMLLVMFGEYVPFVDYLPENFFLRTLCQRADFGKQPIVFFLYPQNGNEINNKHNNYQQKHIYLVSSNICFESSSSWLIRQQVLTLKKQGEDPDILINISNDGWFRHSSQIDMHLATHIFRAVENRTPYLAAANGGFSVGIDGSGHILAIGQRAKNQVVYVELTDDRRFSPYHYLGHFFDIASMGIIIFVVLCPFLRVKHLCCVKKSH